MTGLLTEYVPNNRMDGIIVTSSWLKTYEKLGEKNFESKLDALFEKLKEKRVIVYSQAGITLGGYSSVCVQA